MNTNSTIRRLMRTKNIMGKDLAPLAGMKTTSQLSVALKSDIRISTYIRIIEALGCKLVIQDGDNCWELNINTNDPIEL